MILKKDDDADDDSSEVEEDPELADDEVWLHAKSDGNTVKKKKTIAFKVWVPGFKDCGEADRNQCYQPEFILHESSMIYFVRGQPSIPIEKLIFGQRCPVGVFPYVRPSVNLSVGPSIHF